MDDRNPFETRLEDLAKQIAAVLKTKNRKCVFAESCTGGKMAAVMTAVPGISANFCGSAVTYREPTKTNWLSISASDLEKHTAESVFTTIEMAKAVLIKTPEADFSVAITGHLGPGVDAKLDGIVYVSVANRATEQTPLTTTRHRLTGSNRKERQAESACIALEQLVGLVQKN